jgi:cobalamin-dependent methionine synthase I
VIIGERINPTGRKRLAEEMAAGNYDRVVSDALAQVQVGAQMLDVNAGIPLADEPAILAQAVRLVQSVVDAAEHRFFHRSSAGPGWQLPGQAAGQFRHRGR